MKKFVTALSYQEGRKLSCQGCLCQDVDEELAHVLAKSELKVTAYWQTKKKSVSVLLALHVANQGQGPVLQLLPGVKPNSDFIAEHLRCRTDDKAIVIRVDGTREVLFTPMMSRQENGSQVPVFWGYVLPPGLPSLVTVLVDSAKLALVFDLDETLLVAHTMDTLKARVQACGGAREDCARDLETQLTSEERDNQLLCMRSFEIEEQMARADLQMLRQYSSTDRVHFNGQEYTPRLEVVKLENGTRVERPIIRLPEDTHIFTRIDPSEAKTSMIIRPRPKWNEMRAMLAGEPDPLEPEKIARQRFDVYVCTAAERQYALEVWRLLDATGAIIPKEQRKVRITNVVKEHKNLMKTLLNGMAEVPVGKAGIRDADGKVSGLMPMGVVVDDRINVWDAASAPHVLQVLQWQPYKDAAQRQAGMPNHQADQTEKELIRVRNAILELRAAVFKNINEVVKPQVATLLKNGAPAPMALDSSLSQLPLVATVPALMRNPNSLCHYFSVKGGAQGLPAQNHFAPVPGDGDPAHQATGNSQEGTAPTLPPPPAPHAKKTHAASVGSGTGAGAHAKAHGKAGTKPGAVKKGEAPGPWHGHKPGNLPKLPTVKEPPAANNTTTTAANNTTNAASNTAAGPSGRAPLIMDKSMWSLDAMLSPPSESLPPPPPLPPPPALTGSIKVDPEPTQFSKQPPAVRKFGARLGRGSSGGSEDGQPDQLSRGSSLEAEVKLEPRGSGAQPMDVCEPALLGVEVKPQQLPELQQQQQHGRLGNSGPGRSAVPASSTATAPGIAGGGKASAAVPDANPSQSTAPHAQQPTSDPAPAPAPVLNQPTIRSLATQTIQTSVPDCLPLIRPLEQACLQDPSLWVDAVSVLRICEVKRETVPQVKAFITEKGEAGLAQRLSRLSQALQAKLRAEMQAAMQQQQGSVPARAAPKQLSAPTSASAPQSGRSAPTTTSATPLQSADFNGHRDGRGSQAGDANQTQGTVIGGVLAPSTTANNNTATGQQPSSATNPSQHPCEGLENTTSALSHGLRGTKRAPSPLNSVEEGHPAKATRGGATSPHSSHHLSKASSHQKAKHLANPPHKTGHPHHNPAHNTGNLPPSSKPPAPAPAPAPAPVPNTNTDQLLRTSSAESLQDSVGLSESPSLALLHQAASTAAVALRCYEHPGKVQLNQDGSVAMLHNRGCTALLFWGSKPLVASWSSNKADAKLQAAKDALAVLGVERSGKMPGRVTNPEFLAPQSSAMAIEAWMQQNGLGGGKGPQPGPLRFEEMLMTEVAGADRC